MCSCSRSKRTLRSTRLWCIECRKLLFPQKVSTGGSPCSSCSVCQCLVPELGLGCTPLRALQSPPWPLAIRPVHLQEPPLGKRPERLLEGCPSLLHNQRRTGGVGSPGVGRCGRSRRLALPQDLRRGRHGSMVEAPVALDGPGVLPAPLKLEGCTRAETQSTEQHGEHTRRGCQQSDRGRCIEQRQTPAPAWAFPARWRGS